MQWDRDLIYLGVYDKALGMTRDLGPRAAARFVRSSIRLLIKSYHPDANPQCAGAAKEGMLRLNRIKERFDLAGEEALATYLAGRAQTCAVADARILLVEPDGELRERFEEELRNEGFVVSTASNGVQGMLEHFAFRPMLVITEFDLPLMDGLSLAAELNAKDPEIGVIIMCSRQDHKPDGPKLQARAEASGYGFIEKPFKPSQLYNLVYTGLST